MSLATFLLILVGGVFALLFAAKVVELFFLVVSRIVGFFFRMIRDVFRLVGHAITSVGLTALLLVNTCLLNSSRARHFGRAFLSELYASFATLWRLLLGNLLQMFGAKPLKRIQEEVASAPPADSPASAAQTAFEDYEVIGSLPSGGSGAELFIAKPSKEKRGQLVAAGFPHVKKVVLKSFALAGGPSLPQIMRENRALESAKRLGFVLEHGIDEHRFWYSMPYVPGDNLSVVTKRLHAAAGAEGLPTPQLRQLLQYVSDLLLGLERFHQGGLWHKDVKPENLVVCKDRAYLVDLGLVTPLASSATLTTHGTEYFRDPELVRMSMQGTKVNEVDAIRFDIYGAGAVLYSAVEGSFPAHGGLSQVNKHCPEALQWVVRRSMAELHGRYSSAREMLLDLHKVIEARDPFALKPADLPSMGGDPPQHLPATPSPLREYRPLRHEGPSIHRMGNKAQEESGSDNNFQKTSRKRQPIRMLGLILVFLFAWSKMSDMNIKEAVSKLNEFVSAEVLHSGTSTPRLDGPIPGAKTLRWGKVEMGHLPAPNRPPDWRGPQILVIDDVSAFGSNQLRQELSSVKVALQEYREPEQALLIRGDWGIGEASQDVDILARIRAAVGTQAPSSAQDSIGNILAKQGEISALLWLSRAVSEGEVDAYLLVIGDEHPALVQEKLKLGS
ncbi:MAG: hypothetical protein QGH51_05735 [Planctomycetota bacterium]|nr:hypothetical protein [Planctomycetota bacterium]